MTVEEFVGQRAPNQNTNEAGGGLGSFPDYDGERVTRSAVGLSCQAQTNVAAPGFAAEGQPEP